MDAQAKAKRAEYQRKWRARNKDKVKAYQERTWQRKADQDREKAK